MPSAGIVDAQSGKGAGTVGAGSGGFDVGKKVNGRNWHVVDIMGLLFDVIITTAGVQDRDGARGVLERLRFAMPSVVHIWAAGGDASKLIDWANSRLRVGIEIVRNPLGIKTFQGLSRRQVVERTFAWIIKCRRLAHDSERPLGHCEDDKMGDDRADDPPHHQPDTRTPSMATLDLSVRHIEHIASEAIVNQSAQDVKAPHNNYYY